MIQTHLILPSVDELFPRNTLDALRQAHVDPVEVVQTMLYDWPNSIDLHQSYEKVQLLNDLMVSISNREPEFEANAYRVFEEHIDTICDGCKLFMDQYWPAFGPFIEDETRVLNTVEVYPLWNNSALQVTLMHEPVLRP